MKEEGFGPVAVSGLGLIGGSFAWAMKKRGLRVFGMVRDPAKALAVLRAGAIDAVADGAMLKQCALVLVALPPAASLEFLRKHAGDFAPGSLVIDICGVKRAVCDEAWRIADDGGFRFVGGHPMAGKERAGFANSSAELFRGASMILCFREPPPPEEFARIEGFFLSLGFGRVVTTDPATHDRIIAHTSQLAHVLSASYVRNRAAREHFGFSAGSFRDMIRVAAMDDAVWSELFLDNRDNLAAEIDELIGSLGRFRDAIRAGDRGTLAALIRESAAIKHEIDAADTKG